MPHNLHDLAHTSPGLNLRCADPSQPPTAAGEELDYLLIDHDLSQV